MQRETEFTSDGVIVAQGDAVEILDVLVENSSVKLIFADPPYNIGKSFGEFRDKWPSDTDYAEWCDKWLEISVRKFVGDDMLDVMTITQAMP